MIELASHIVDVSLERKKYVYHLQLQKITYYTVLQGLKLNLIDKDTFEELYKYKSDRFTTSRYGPRSETIFLRYGVFGAERIFTNSFSNYYLRDMDFSRLNPIILPLLEEQTMDLCRKSMKNPIFEERFKNNKELSIEDIFELSEKYSDLK
jgi:hypothetical protein